MMYDVFLNKINSSYIRNIMPSFQEKYDTFQQMLVPILYLKSLLWRKVKARGGWSIYRLTSLTFIYKVLIDALPSDLKGDGVSRLLFSFIRYFLIRMVWELVSMVFKACIFIVLCVMTVRGKGYGIISLQSFSRCEFVLEIAKDVKKKRYLFYL